MRKTGRKEAFAAAKVMVINMLLKIAVADTDQSYLERLSDVLGEYDDLSLSVYSDPEILHSELVSSRFDVLLIDPSIYSGQLPTERVGVVIVLAGDGRATSLPTDFPEIRKYQRISRIHSQILEICSERLELTSAPGKNNARLIAFWSPVGGCGKTTASLIAATRLAAAGRRTFYLNLESFPSDGCYLPQESQNSLSTLLERLGQKREQVVMYLTGALLTKGDNLYYLKHFDSPNDYIALGVDELSTLLDILKKSCAIDVVIIDTQSCFDDKVKLIFDKSDRVVLVEKPDAVSKLKYEKFQAQSYIINEYGVKFRRLCNFYNGRPSDLETTIKEIGRIGVVAGPDGGSLIASKAGSSESDFALSLLND